MSPTCCCSTDMKPMRGSGRFGSLVGELLESAKAT